MIMDAAKDLFIEKGYQHVSVRQIAKQLGCSHGAIYYHFKNKAELFYAIVEEFFGMLEQKLTEILNRDIDADEKLKEILLGFIEFGMTYQNHYEIIFLIKDEDVQYFLSEKPNIVYQKFANAVYELSEHKLSVKEIWSIFLSLHGFVTEYLRNGTNYEQVKDTAADHVDFLLKRIY
ncbi:TetR/AcrR family transcriptional regulator [Fervidibacillus halotolerans]|uniref:TetR/AcrR family transcriptional regulator n=1 Tax=Fervidibacillus halotolerans TaxID=2980027 RepID=A0A9E8M1U4_9BACI|nr:TetR/AcrR family transcriptional regulator [Fervidibacillus halotolerans]WAA13973.1 TetR/AcrR family transcriptional regulator [Fervidibacillus halotolerans]